jgi:hypothetical protein
MGLVIGLLFPESKMTQHSWHWLGIGLAEFFVLYRMLTEDAISKIELNTSQKKVLFYFYNIYQGQMEEQHSFDDLKLDIVIKRKRVREIEFFTRKTSLFTLNKEKDGFRQEILENLKDTLYELTSVKA